MLSHSLDLRCIRSVFDTDPFYFNKLQIQGYSRSYLTDVKLIMRRRVDLVKVVENFYGGRKKVLFGLKRKREVSTVKLTFKYKR